MALVTRRWFARHGSTASVCVAMCVAMLAAAPSGAQSWRSDLYPEDWAPGLSDAQGRTLQDFSYAGYRRGEVPVPDVQGPIFDVPAPTGGDDTALIQAIINQAEAAGGGVVRLAEGTYRLAPPAGRAEAIRIGSSNIVLRGRGADRTFLLNTSTSTRGTVMILAAPSGSPSWPWTSPRGAPQQVSGAVPAGSTEITLAQPFSGQPGDWILLRGDANAAFIARHGMTGEWDASLRGPMFYREVAEVSPDGRTVTLDIPTRYRILGDEHPRIERLVPHLQEVGVEDLSIGSVEHPGRGFGDSDYTQPGTAAYDVHNSYLLELRHVVNGWVRRVRSYAAPGNASGFHSQSNLLLLMMSRNITVADCLMAHPQYEGGGGNGYGYSLRGADCLIVDSRADDCRHNFNFRSLWTSGNVILRCDAANARLPSDYHMHLSPANLIDNMTLDSDYLEGHYRNSGTVTHGHSTTESVFWNTRSVDDHPRRPGVAVVSKQFGHGYVIGTRGPVTGVQTTPTVMEGHETAPADWIEGAGLGDTLEPASLYEDQLRRRLSPPPPPPCAADMNSDGEVDVRDLLDFLAAFRQGC